MSNELVLANEKRELATLIEMNLGPDGKLSANDITEVTMPKGGNTTFRIPTPEGDTNASELEGIVVFKTKPRARYANAYSPGSKERPVCSSRNGDFGVPYDKETETYGNPIPCGQCPYAKWGKDEKTNKPIPPACGQHMELLLMTDHELLPMKVRVAATSLGNMDTYFKGLLKRNQYFFEVRTRITAEEDETKTGQTCTRLIPTKVTDLDEDQRLDAERLHLMMEKMMAFQASEDEDEVDAED